MKSAKTSFSPQSRNVALVVAAAFFMQMLDGVVIVTALPEMAISFGVDTLAMSIGVTIYMLAAAIFIPTAGWLADRFGDRRVFMGAIALFTLASLACGLAQTLDQFVMARAVQGIGGAVMVPVGRIIVLRSAKKSEIVQAIGLIVWPALFAPVVGPAIGGFLTTYASWQWNFWINLPIGLLGLVLVARIVPADGPARLTSFDWVGFLLCALSLAGLLYGFEAFANGSVSQQMALLLIVVGLMSGVLTVLWLRRRQHPLLHLDALRIQTFATSEAYAGGALRLAINATPYLLPLFFQIAFGLDPFQAGGLVVAYFLGNLAMKTVTTRLLRLFGFRRILVVNGVLAALAIAGCGLLEAETPYVIVIAVLFIAGLTRSMQFTALATLAFADIDAEHRSSASTLSTMFQQISMVFGIALATGILNASQVLSATVTLTLADFRIAFLLMAGICLAGSLATLRLPADAGTEVSGHRLA
ncbi:MAG TPA: DHA2 family efflux MFS transporter permease subunit [Devosia sp.]|nr:DHA2 family efflux MFS transporter permease subunit [Devosia sp.]